MGAHKVRWREACLAGATVVALLFFVLARTVGSRSLRGWPLRCDGQGVHNDVVSNGVDFNWKAAIESTEARVNSLPGTTGAGVPGKFRTWLTSTGVAIDDNAQDHFGSEAAVRHMETKECGGWDKATSAMRKPECLNDLGFVSGHEAFLPDPSEIDIVTPSIRNLDFLNDWREFFQGFHVIIIQDGDQSKVLEVPDWVDYELHKRVDIERTLGNANAWIISQKDASIRNYGFLLSKKRYVYTIDDDCRPAYDRDGRKINPLALHYRNLKTPSTPYMFNTLYDPYQDGSDFVRGYPYSLRPGVPTGVSHGIWMNAPDYDAPTQLMKVHERVAHMHEIVQTVPAGIFFPLCSMNVAFDRKLIGPAMMQGLMGVGQPWARYDDMFSGWAAKSIADHLGVGVKSGMPYIRHNKASNPFVNLRKEYLGLWWQEMVLRFFMNDVKYSADADTPSKCYRELAAQIRKTLRPTHEYFDRLAEAMERWTDSWDKAEAGNITFTPSRQFKSSEKPINLNDRSKDIFGVKKNSQQTNINLAKDKDVEVKFGRPSQKLKIFVYDLPSEYTLEKYLEDVEARTEPKSNCDWNMHVCAEEWWAGEYSTLRQYGADVVLIQKFRKYGNRVTDPAQADLFVVPYPHSSDCRRYDRGCWYACDCVKEDVIERLLKSLPYLTEENRKKHLFLLTGDMGNHSPLLLKQPLYASLGSRRTPKSKSTMIVIPPPNTEPAYQPSALAAFNWTKPRTLSVFMNIGLVTQARKDAFALLSGVQQVGGLPVEVHEIAKHRDFKITPKEVWRKYRETVFCPITQGDLPYQKRFFDVVISGCVPVVVAFESGECESYPNNHEPVYDVHCDVTNKNPRRSWFKRGNPGYDWTHPFAFVGDGKKRRGASIDYSEFVVEVNSLADMIPAMEKLLSGDQEKLRKMQTAMGRAARSLVYGLDDDLEVSGDAFDEILGQLEEYVAGIEKDQSQSF